MAGYSPVNILLALLLITIAIMAVTACLQPPYPGSEDSYNLLFCDSVEGRTEVKHYYDYQDGHSHVRVDCETETHVYECGLDKRSSLDSLQQALFFSRLTGKKPAVVIYDTDGREGRYEYRIRSASEMVGVEYIRSLVQPH